MTPARLLHQLCLLHDRGDHATLLTLLGRERHRIEWVSERPTAGVGFVAFSTRGPSLTARVLIPRLAEREALIIRTAVNRALLDHEGRLDELVVDFSAVTTVAAPALRLFADLRRNAKIFGAKTRGVGVPEPLAQTIRRFRLGART